MKLNLPVFLTSILLLVFLQSCKKNWLDAKPDKSLNVPDTIEDFQNLLDNSSQIFNATQAGGIAEISAGDFYILYSSWQGLFSIQEKTAYIWESAENFYQGSVSADWETAYTKILNANVILEGIEKIKPSNAEYEDWRNVKGSAFFLRAFDYYNLAQQFCKAYLPATANSDLGLPLRLTYDVNLKVGRASLQQTYDQIIGDLKSAAELLRTVQTIKTRPSRQATYAMLARTYLAMEFYEEAGLYADSALKIEHELLDYSALQSTAAYPMKKFNSEVLFHNTFSYGIFNSSRLIVDPTLYNMYDGNYYRKSLFFATSASGVVTYKGSYSGDRLQFGGLALNEVYLIRAEANVRAGNLPAALADLNVLLRKRRRGNPNNLNSKDPEVVLRWVLNERRKELLFRGIRWSDLRRLNRDQRFAVTLTRTMNGVTYTLPPNDKRYVFPIDDEEIRLSGIPQN